MAYDNEVRERGVYVVRDKVFVMYIGSSKCMRSTLEHNHRNWEAIAITSKFDVHGPLS